MRSSTSYGELYDALTRAQCFPSRLGVAICPLCKKANALKIRKRPRLALACSNGCAESDIAAELEVGLANVVPLVPTGSKTGTGSGSPPLRGEPQNRGPSSTTGLEPLFESLESLVARAMKTPPLDWLIAPLVMFFGSLFLVAPPNAGKTFFALVIAKTAAALGRRVFIIEEEGGLRAFSTRIANLSFPAGSPVSVALQRGLKLDPRTTTELGALLAKEEAPVLILDNLGAMFEGDENETRAASALMHRLMDLQRANPRLLLVLLHHSSKSGAKGDNGPMLYAARGSSVFSGWCDTQLNLEGISEPEGSGRVSFFVDVAKQRDEEKAARHRMSIALGTGEVTLVKAERAAQDDRAQKILGALARHAGGLSRNAIADEVGGNKQQLLRTISRLLVEGVCAVDDRNLIRVAAKKTNASEAA